ADDLFLISRAKAPRGKIIRIPLAQPDVSRAETIVPEGENTIVTSFGHTPSSVLAMQTRLYVTYQLGGPSELRVFDLKGKRVEAPKQLAVSTVAGLTKLDGDDVLFNNLSYIAPPAYYRFDAKAGATTKTALATNAPVDYSDIEVVREFATSKDG